MQKEGKETNPNSSKLVAAVPKVIPAVVAAKGADAATAAADTDVATIVILVESVAEAAVDGLCDHFRGRQEHDREDGGEKGVEDLHLGFFM